MSRVVPVPDVCDGIVVTEEQIARRVAELGAAISAEHAGEDVRFVTVLRGGLFFLADLCRRVDFSVPLDFMSVAQYVPGQGGAVRVTKDLSDGVEGSTLILVEDVVDTGLTVNYVRSFLLGHGPARLEVCALFDKPARRIAEVPIAYKGFELSDRFLVGYGLDLDGRYRNLPYVASLKDEAVYG